MKAFNLLFKTRNWSWWELGIIKWSSFLCGMFVGSFWFGIFAPYSFWLLGAGLALGFVGLVRWLKK